MTLLRNGLLDTKGKLGGVCFFYLFCYRTFTNVLLLLFSCSNAPLDLSGDLALKWTKGKLGVVFFLFISL